MSKVDKIMTNSFCNSCDFYKQSIAFIDADIRGTLNGILIFVLSFCIAIVQLV
jgi:hypothetical protein